MVDGDLGDERVRQCGEGAGLLTLFGKMNKDIPFPGCHNEFDIEK